MACMHAALHSNRDREPTGLAQLDQPWGFASPPVHRADSRRGGAGTESVCRTLDPATAQRAKELPSPHLCNEAEAALCGGTQVIVCGRKGLIFRLRPLTAVQRTILARGCFWFRFSNPMHNVQRGWSILPWAPPSTTSLSDSLPPPQYHSGSPCVRPEARWQRGLRWIYWTASTRSTICPQIEP